MLSTQKYGENLHVNYSPFGAVLPGRNHSTTSYRYGFQGQERDDEMKGEGNSVNFTYRMHDPRLGRFFAVDPLTGEYPFYSPYAFSGNRLVDMIELEGLEPLKAGKITELGITQMSKARLDNIVSYPEYRTSLAENNYRDYKEPGKSATKVALTYDATYSDLGNTNGNVARGYMVYDQSQFVKLKEESRTGANVIFSIQDFMSEGHQVNGKIVAPNNSSNVSILDISGNIVRRLVFMQDPLNNSEFNAYFTLLPGEKFLYQGMGPASAFNELAAYKFDPHKVPAPNLINGIPNPMPAAAVTPPPKTDGDGIGGTGTGGTTEQGEH